jgi:hypothetical protein
MGSDLNSVSLVAVEQDIVGAVCVDVDHPRCDRRARRQSEIAWSLACKHSRNAAVFNDEPAVLRGAGSEGKLSRPQGIGS